VKKLWEFAGKKRKNRTLKGTLTSGRGQERCMYCPGSFQRRAIFDRLRAATSCLPKKAGFVIPLLFLPAVTAFVKLPAIARIPPALSSRCRPSLDSRVLRFESRLASRPSWFSSLTSTKMQEVDPMYPGYFKTFPCLDNMNC
jgi:hypothetical protein